MPLTQLILIQNKADSSTPLTHLQLIGGDIENQQRLHSMNGIRHYWYYILYWYVIS